MREQIGKYRIEGVIGEGGMGTVYRASDPVLARTVAMKVLCPELAGDRSLVRRFEEEARALARLQHPNVMRVYAVGEDGPLRYYAMEFVVGSTLEGILKERGALPADEAMDIFRQVAKAVRAIHDAGIVHRDIKPNNIMIDENGRIILMDFGLAKSFDRATFTAAGSILGTPEYMAPEQAQGGRVDSRADVYSLASVLFEMLCGVPPYEGKDSFSVIRQKLERPPPSVQARRPDLPRGAEQIFRRALAARPDDRFPDVNALARALDVLFPPPAERRDRVSSSPSPAAAEAEEPRPNASQAAGVGTRSGRRRHDFVSWALVVFGALAGLAGMFLLLYPHRTATSAGPPTVPEAEHRPSTPAPGRGFAVEVRLADGRTIRGEWLETLVRRDPADGRRKLYARFRDHLGTIHEKRLEDPSEVFVITRVSENGKGGEEP